MIWVITIFRAVIRIQEEIILRAAAGIWEAVIPMQGPGIDKIRGQIRIMTHLGIIRTITLSMTDIGMI